MARWGRGGKNREGEEQWLHEVKAGEGESRFIVVDEIWSIAGFYRAWGYAEALSPEYEWEEYSIGKGRVLMRCIRPWTLFGLTRKKEPEQGAGNG